MLPIIAAGITLISQLVNYVGGLRAHARRTGELTPEQDAEFDAEIQRVIAQDHWKIPIHDPNPGPAVE